MPACCFSKASLTALNALVRLAAAETINSSARALALKSNRKRAGDKQRLFQQAAGRRHERVRLGRVPEQWLNAYRNIDEVIALA